MRTFVVLAIAAGVLAPLDLAAATLSLSLYPQFTNSVPIKDPASAADAIDSGQTVNDPYGIGSASYRAHVAFGNMGFDLGAGSTSVLGATGTDGGVVTLGSTDVLFFTGIADGWVGFDFHVEGDITGGGGDQYSGGLVTYSMSYNPGVSGFFISEGLGSYTGSSYVDAAPSSTVNASFQAGHLVAYGTDMAPISNGMAFLPISMEGQVSCSVDDTHPSCGYNLEFLHTAVVGGARVFDSSGAPVAGVTFTSESGHDYSGPLSSVPEPATAWMLAGAIAGMGLFRRRKPRHY